MDIKAMFRLSYGLYVLSAEKDGFHNGCIINTAAQVTSEPNRISITVSKQNLTHDMVYDTGIFNVSVLDETVPFSVFQKFGFQSGRTTQKFTGVRTEAAGNGLLYLSENTDAFISGKVFSKIDLGTHTMFLADVTDCGILSENDPVTYTYYQKNIKPAPQKTSKKGFRCNICGYIYEGETLPPDFICPLCKHGAADFTAI